MAQCSNCLKKGFFLKVDKKHGLCNECFSYYGDDEKIGRTLSNISDSLSGEYGYEEDKEMLEIKKKKMFNILKTCEKYSGGVESNSPDVLYYTAVAYRNYCSWYVRGDDRKECLENYVNYMERLLTIEPDNNLYITNFAIEIIENKPIRDLERAITLLEKLKLEKTLPQYALVFLHKAYRWTNQTDKISSLDLSSMNLYPAGLREARTILRKKIIQNKKEKNIEQLKLELRDLYKLALFESTIYGQLMGTVNGCSPTNFVYEFVPLIEKKLDDFSYEKNGIIKYTDFLSDRDYSNFKKIWGETTKTISCLTIFDKEKRLAHSKYEKKQKQQLKRMGVKPLEELLKEFNES